MNPETIAIVKVLLPTAVAFIVGTLSTPLLTHHLYKYRVWKKVGGKIALDGSSAHEFNRLHGEREGHTPRMGGILIWSSVFITAGLLLVGDIITSDESLFTDMNMLSRSQTLIPLVVFAIGAFVGFLNDYYDVSHVGGGIRLRVRLAIITILSSVIGSWFYLKVGVDAIGIPYVGEVVLGALIVPFFITMSIAIYASGIIDGIDGLSGGVFGIIYGAYAMLAFHQGQFDIAALAGTMAGAILAFLWFNIPPARFWMTETGTMPLTLTLAVIALMTDTMGNGYGVSVLPIIGFLLVVTVLSTTLQIASKRFRGKKLFRVAPLHHHFEAIGWPSYKVTMRYWIIGIIAAIVGLIIAFTG
jgi:phospho-N-acetylmuramoyl-pentapeptide-transferase